jgi:hypothetical protein
MADGYFDRCPRCNGEWTLNRNVFTFDKRPRYTCYGCDVDDYVPGEWLEVELDNYVVEWHFNKNTVIVQKIKPAGKIVMLPLCLPFDISPEKLGIYLLFS